MDWIDRAQDRDQGTVMNILVLKNIRKFLSS
jgi:hypothetical protein